MTFGWIPLRFKTYLLAGLAFLAGLLGWRASIAHNAVQRERDRLAVRQGQDYREIRQRMDAVRDPPSVDAARGILRDFSDE